MTIKHILHVLYSMHSLEPDVQSEDGIYSAYVHRGCQGDNGRHNSKVIITGNADTVVTLYSSSEAAIIGTCLLV